MVLPPEDLTHEKTETIRKGTGNRVHYRCSNPKCEEPIRNDKWDTHVLKACSDLHLQEAPEDVLERTRLSLACSVSSLSWNSVTTWPWLACTGKRSWRKESRP